MMGINVSTSNNRSTSSSGEFLDQVERNNQIEAQLREDRKIGALTRKLLLLGAAEAGKSTVLKQLRVLHENKFNEAELTTMKLAIYNNVLLISHAIFEVMSTRNMRFENDHSELDKVVVLMAIRTKACRDSLQRDVAEALLRLKKDRIFKHCYTNFNQYLIPESSE
uniref:Uncharacterized protein n=1 Tax=Romanomermis culicivorax TaxID=13658 RepID=A0A915J8J0_ROMCU